MSSAVSVRAARRVPILIGALAASALAFGMANPQGAVAQGPWWHLESRAAPSNLPPGGEGRIVVSASNVGTLQADGSHRQITITDVLPPRLKATAISGGGSYPEEEPPMSCSLERLSCTYTGSVLPYKRLEVMIHVSVQPGGAGQEQNTMMVEGGGAPSTPALSRPVTISSAPTPFGVEGYALIPEEEGGSTDMQAGSHPFQLTATFDLNQTLALGRFGEGPFPQAPALTRNLAFRLPPGLVGNPTAVARCAEVDFATIGEDGFTNLCPPNTAVGAAVVTIYEPVLLKFSTVTVPLFNLVPAQGEPARFGFEVFKVPVVLDTAVRASEGYGVTVSVTNASQAAAILGSQVTFWGQPGAEAHDHARGWACLDLPFQPERAALKDCTSPVEHSTAAFLTLPTSCSGVPLESSVEGVSWPTAGASEGEGLQASASFGPLSGCGALPFSPSIAVELDQHSASSPSGVTVDVHVPQASTIEGGQVAESAIRNTTVTLPEGVQVSPSAATGLLTCTGQEVGLDPGVEESSQTDNESFSETLPVCPEQAKVATVRIKTPLLDHELEGAAYLASQNTNPFAAPLVLYLLVHDPISDVQVKLAGTVTPNPVTGQLTSTFANTPQLPFEQLKLHFFDGARASLSTPPLCGSYQTQASFTPWSGAATASASASFPITSGPDGSPCPAAQPFAPSFNAQSTDAQAGAFTPFSLTLQNPDGDQALTGLTVHLPEGVAAILASVTLCPEPQAALNQCGPESEIGHSTVSSGLGPDPVSLPGSVYLTGPYEGAPFGISVVTPAIAGPFNLGDVTVRSRINVDPNTAAVTITSDPFPTFVKGVPAQIKQINVTVDRPNFEFNPTNCNPMAISGTLSGAQGGSEAVSSPFQVSGCSALPFHPKLTAAAGGAASKANGANFDVKVESKGLGQANIAKVRLQLPKALPARLTTLQKACTEKAFAANPASCPGGSVIGTATIHTPVLSSPLSGPAYLVSHGGAAFPDVEFVLQGEGITLVLDGKTQIKNQITYSKFESAPDAPFTVFETVLPAGPHSALTANLPEKAKFNLCKSSLSMPTEIVGQNGTVLKQNTKIALQGCKKVTASKPISRATLLRRALASCRKHYKHAKAKRLACDKQASKRYTAKKAAHKARKSSGRKGSRA